ncbi:MAG TPA: hypothetical protein VJ969_04750, partial [Desulfopila sp.]|nr:hypothetical protein [Desulfopila sp.]
RRAIDSQADLSAFKEKPTPVVIAGIFAMAFSYIIGWPLIAALGFLSLQFDNPWIVSIGGPLAYGASHLVFMLGMYLSGSYYSLIFLRWLTRISVEKVLRWCQR